MKTGNVYCIEQHVRVNTVAADGSANRDGLIEIFVDGVLVYADTQAQVTKSANAGITSIPFANFYHGGTGVPRAPIHYEFSGVAVSPRYIGPPKRRPTTRSSSAWPTWRRHIAIGQVAAIAGSSMALLNANNANAINAWTGLAAGAVDWWLPPRALFRGSGRSMAPAWERECRRRLSHQLWLAEWDQHRPSPPQVLARPSEPAAVATPMTTAPPQDTMACSSACIAIAAPRTTSGVGSMMPWGVCQGAFSWPSSLA